MERIRTALVVDDSKLVTAVMEATLRPHCERVLCASGLTEATRLLPSLGNEDLVLTDVVMNDGDGFALLTLARAMSPTPAIIVCSAYATPENQRRAQELSALAFLAKPLSAHAVLLAWGKHRRGAAVVERAPRVRLFANVFVDDDALAYEIHDLSKSGAFLVTHGPLPIGARLRLTIVAKELRTTVHATVVRVQEPSWLHVGGVGVQFEDPREAEINVLLQMILRFGHDG